MIAGASNIERQSPMTQSSPPPLPRHGLTVEAAITIFVVIAIAAFAVFATLKPDTGKFVPQQVVQVKVEPQESLVETVTRKTGSSAARVHVSKGPRMEIGFDLRCGLFSSEQDLKRKAIALAPLALREPDWKELVIMAGCNMLDRYRNEIYDDSVAHVVISRDRAEKQNWRNTVPSDLTNDDGIRVWLVPALRDPRP